MDPRRCISYLTIEHRGAIPLALRPAIENWIFGCDVCQEVCPWNRDARAPAADDELAPFLPELLALDAAGFRARFRGTAVTRTRRARPPAQRRRGARQQRQSATPCRRWSRRSRDPEPLVRGHAAWALGRLGGSRRARSARARAPRRARTPTARAELDGRARRRERAAQTSGRPASSRTPSSASRRSRTSAAARDARRPDRCRRGMRPPAICRGRPRACSRARAAGSRPRSRRARWCGSSSAGSPRTCRSPPPTRPRRAAGGSRRPRRPCRDTARRRASR